MSFPCLGLSSFLIPFLLESCSFLSSLGITKANLLGKSLNKTLIKEPPTIEKTDSGKGTPETVFILTLLPLLFSLPP